MTHAQAAEASAGPIKIDAAFDSPECRPTLKPVRDAIASADLRTHADVCELYAWVVSRIEQHGRDCACADYSAALDSMADAEHELERAPAVDAAEVEAARESFDRWPFSPLDPMQQVWIAQQRAALDSRGWK